MQSNDSNQNAYPHVHSLKDKQTMFFTQIRRKQLIKELRSRRADQYMSENEVKETLQTKYRSVFDDILKGYEDTEEFKLKTGDMRGILESVSDTYYFNQILAENKFIDKIFANLSDIHAKKLHLKPEYEDSVEVCLWFLCNALKYGFGFSELCNENNFDIIFDIMIDIVSAKCLYTYCNLLANFIICLSDENLTSRLKEIRDKYISEIISRLKLAMNDIVTLDKDAKNLIDGAIFLFLQCKRHMYMKIDILEVIL